MGDSKQKIKLAILVIIIAIVIWQVMGLFGSSAPAPAPEAPVSVAPATATSATAPTAPQPAASTASTQDQIKQAPIQTSPVVFKMQQENQQEYITKLNKLELLKIDREIEETNGAISKAKLEVYTTEKNISELLSATTTTPPTGNPASPGSLNNQTPGQRQPIAAAPAPREETLYNLQSVYFEGSRWTAVIGYNGNAYTFKIGDTLPDNTVVTAIDRQGVTLERDGSKRHLDILASAMTADPNSMDTGMKITSSTSANLNLGGPIPSQMPQPVTPVGMGGLR